jgi:hypothetical protein
MSPNDSYGDHAAECLALAQHSPNPNDKARLLLMAEAWRVLAEKQEAKSLQHH